jgi:septin family protein
MDDIQERLKEFEEELEEYKEESQIAKGKVEMSLEAIKKIGFKDISDAQSGSETLLNKINKRFEIFLKKRDAFVKRYNDLLNR